MPSLSSTKTHRFFSAVVIWHDLWNPPRAGFSVKSGPRRMTAGAAAVGWCWFKAHIPICFLCSRKAKPAGPRLLGVHGFWGCRCTWETRKLVFFFPNEYLNWLLTVSWVRYYCPYFLSFFLPCCVACGILVLQLRIELRHSAVNAWSPNHRTARETLSMTNFMVTEKWR